MKKKILFEIEYNDEDESKDVLFNIVFLDTGEIRQKRRSVLWLFKRVFESEIKTWKKRWDEEFELEYHKNIDINSVALNKNKLMD